MTTTNKSCALPAFLLSMAAVGVPVLAQSATEEVLHNFGRSQGAEPNTGVIRDSEGNLYGTAFQGGSQYSGVLFEVDTAGNYKALHVFNRDSNGWSPNAVVRDDQGNFYGTTAYGGSTFGGTTPCYTFGCGVVYKLDSAGHYTVLHNFTSGTDGANPSSGVIRDSAGNLYGTTDYGGTANQGVIYKLDPAGNCTVLYSFTSGIYGTGPSGLLRDSDGNLFGTTYEGGTYSLGSLFKLDPAGNYTVLHDFTSLDGDGANPFGGLIRDEAGNLYGATTYGPHGSGSSPGAGVVYKLDVRGHFTVLYTFTGGADGGQPRGGLIRDDAGNLYGTTSLYGAGGAGVAFRIDTSGHETVLHSFTGKDGDWPQGSLVRDAGGALYGTAAYGGATNGGVVFKLDTSGNEIVLHSFPYDRLGAYPSSALSPDSAGDLIGPASSGGTGGGGVLYRVGLGGYSVLYNFSGPDGASPYGGVISDPLGSLYGTTYSGGAYGCCGGYGVVYKLDKAGHQTVLYSFTGGADGGGPATALARDDAGNLYGTTVQGGTPGCGQYGCGVVFEVDPSGKETVLHSFSGGATGGQPQSAVIRDSEGNLYGTAGAGTSNSGLIYKLDAAGHYRVLYTFTGKADGNAPVGDLIRDQTGNLYGATYLGGSMGVGVVYRLDATGHETVLYNFLGGANGGYPRAGVISDPVGNLYGTTSVGGTGNAGVVYKLDTAGNYTVLYSFASGNTDGCLPQSGLWLDPAGNLFGTTYACGKRGTGVVFEVKP